MGLFDKFKKGSPKLENEDYMGLAEQYLSQGNYLEAIETYKKIIQTVYKNKSSDSYRHLTQRIVDCYIKLGDYEKVIELWPLQFHSADYSPKDMYELIKFLEASGRNDLALRVFERAGKKLLRNKIEFLIKNRRIPEANEAINELLASVEETNPAILGIWLTKAKVSMSLLKFPEARRYLDKIIEKNPRNEEARKLKEFCAKHMND